MPVVLVFTKFDEIVTKVLRDRHGGDTQHHALARARAQQEYEDSCRHLFDKAPGKVPAGVVSSTFISQRVVEGLTSSIILREFKFRRSSR